MNDIIVTVLKNGTVVLTDDKIGYNGENKARNIIVKLEEFIEDGTAVLEINQHSKKYFLTLEEREQMFVLPIRESLLAYSEIEMQFRLIKDENIIIKSEIFKFEIDDSINAIDKKIPEEYSDWFIDTTNKLSQLESKIDEVEGSIPDVSEFITKDVDNLTNYTKNDVLESEYAKKKDFADYIKKDVSDLENYYDKTTIDDKVSTLENKDSEIDAKVENVKTDLADNYYNKTQIDSKLTSAIKYKGEVENYSDLETLQGSVENGDCYNIKNASEFNKAGDNAVWNDEQQAWDILSGVVDLSDYYKATQVDEKIDEETRDLLQGLSRELKSDEEDGGFSPQTVVNVKNKSGATEMIMEIDNLDITTNVPTNSVLGTLKGQDFENRIKALENGGGEDTSNVVILRCPKSFTILGNAYKPEDDNSDEIKEFYTKVKELNDNGKDIIIILTIRYLATNYDLICGVVKNDTEFNIIVPNSQIAYKLYSGNEKVNQYTNGYVSLYKDGINFNKFTISNTAQVYGFNTDTSYPNANTCLSIKNVEEYIPTGDYNPATKKYVDDSIVSAITGALEGEY